MALRARKQNQIKCKFGRRIQNSLLKYQRKIELEKVDETTFKKNSLEINCRKARRNIFEPIASTGMHLLFEKILIKR